MIPCDLSALSAPSRFISLMAEMAMTSNEMLGLMDIKNLLDLLNASEEDAAPQDYSEAVLSLSEAEPADETIERQKVLPSTSVQADPGAPNSPVPDDVGNRFAAHIVHGMSKRRAQ
jgi:hypothetical protein